MDAYILRPLLCERTSIGVQASHATALRRMRVQTEDPEVYQQIDSKTVLPWLGIVDVTVGSYWPRSECSGISSTFHGADVAMLSQSDRACSFVFLFVVVCHFGNGR